MPPRNPTSDADAQAPEDDGFDDRIEDEPEVEGDDEGADEDSAPDNEQAAGDAEEDGREAAEGGRSSRVLGAERPQRETALQRANRLAREARAEADRNTRELAELRQQLQQRNTLPQETPAEKATRYALMDPEQRVEARFNEAQAASNAQMSRMAAMLADQSDKATFSMLTAGNPLYKRVAGDVETKLAELRRMGQNVDREALAKYIIGEQVLKRAPGRVDQQRQAGQRRIQQERGRPSGGRSDEGAEDRRRQTARQRLENVVF